MKICIIGSHLFFGGFTISMLNMIHQLRKKNVEIDLLFLEPEKHQLPLSTLDEINVLPMEYQKHSNFDIASRIRIKSEKEKCDHFLKQSDESDDENSKKRYLQKYMQSSLLLRARESFGKMDLSEYDCVISWEELLCNDFLAYNVKAKRKIGYIHPDYIKSGFDRECDFSVLKRLDRIVTVSEATKHTLQKVFPEFSDKILHIPFVLNTRKIDQESNVKIRTFDKSGFDIVTLCRLDIAHKGLDRMVRVTDQLNQDGYVFEWYVVGKGEDREKIEKMIAERSISNIHLVGAQDNAYAWIKKADLFVLLSSYEGRPAVVDEAMYLNVPCLVTNYDSASEQIENGKDGLIIGMDDESIYTSLKELMDHKEELTRVRKALIQEDKTKYTDTSAFMDMIEGKI